MRVTVDLHENQELTYLGWQRWMTSEYSCHVLSSYSYGERGRYISAERRGAKEEEDTRQCWLESVLEGVDNLKVN